MNKKAQHLAKGDEFTNTDGSTFRVTHVDHYGDGKTEWVDVWTYDIAHPRTAPIHFQWEANEMIEVRN